MKNFLYRIQDLLVMLVCCTAFISCSDDGDEHGNNNKIDVSKIQDLYGMWYGQSWNENPASGLKQSNLFIRFNTDKTGSLERETPISLSLGVFTYSISGNVVTCVGAYANTNGDVQEDFTLELRLENNRLIPINNYTEYILTKDGSVETDGNGNELIDYSNYLQRVWLSRDSMVVAIFEENCQFVEYILDEPKSNAYIRKTETEYNYDYRRKLVTIGGAAFTLSSVDENLLWLVSTVKPFNEYFYYGASQKDIPTEISWETFLVYHWLWATDNGCSFCFSKDGTVLYEESSSSNKNASLVARGTFSVLGNTLICDFQKVELSGGDKDEYAIIFPGWAHNAPCIKEYKLYKIEEKEIMITDSEGKSKFYKSFF